MNTSMNASRVTATTQDLFQDPDWEFLASLDPSLQDFYKKGYENELEISITSFPDSLPTDELRRQVSPEHNTEFQESLQKIILKIFWTGESDSPSSIKIELSSEQDIWWSYQYVLYAENFEEFKSEQDLN
jgi:hypothetical protein